MARFCTRSVGAVQAQFNIGFTRDQACLFPSVKLRSFSFLSAAFYPSPVFKFSGQVLPMRMRNV